jgi:hypothetical protein
MPVIPTNTLLEETKCYLCEGISQWEAIELGLLSRIASGSGGGGSGSAVWGGITGTLANQLDLQAALNAKTDIYSLMFYNSAFSVLTAPGTFFLGQNGTATTSVQSSYNNVKVVIPVTGTIVAVTVNQFSESSTPSGENITLSLNKNNGTVSALGVITATNPSSTLFSPLAVAVAQGDFLAIQIVTTSFVTTPNNSRWTAQIYIQKT